MKTIILWIKYLLVLLLLLPCLAILFFVFCLLNPLFAKVVCFLLFLSWGYYQYFAIIRKNPRPKGIKVLKSIPFIVILMLVAVFAMGRTGWLERIHIIDIHTQDYQRLLASRKCVNGKTQMLITKIIPPEATEIDFYHNPRFFGDYAYLKCTCPKEALDNFALAQGYSFQAEDMFQNSNPNNPQEIKCTSALVHFHAEKELLDLKNFLTYNFIYENHGGYAFLYIVDKQLLFASYSHN